MKRQKSVDNPFGVNRIAGPQKRSCQDHQVWIQGLFCLVLYALKLTIHWRYRSKAFALSELLEPGRTPRPPHPVPVPPRTPDSPVSRLSRLPAKGGANGLLAFFLFFALPIAWSGISTLTKGPGRRSTADLADVTKGP